MGRARSVGFAERLGKLGMLAHLAGRKHNRLVMGHAGGAGLLVPLREILRNLLDDFGVPRRIASDVR